MFRGLGTVGGGAGSFQLFKRFVFARNDDLRQGKVPVLKPCRLQFDAEPSGDFGLAQAHLFDFPPVELQPFQAVVQFQNKVTVFMPLMTVRREYIRISVFGERSHIFGRKRFQIPRRHTAPVRERHDEMNGAPPVFASAFRFFGQPVFELLRRQTCFRFVRQRQLFFQAFRFFRDVFRHRANRADAFGVTDDLEHRFERTGTGQADKVLL